MLGEHQFCLEPHARDASPIIGTGTRTASNHGAMTYVSPRMNRRIVIPAETRVINV